ncbi:MFS transporter [Flexivirga caeni]|uniref:MFS transporter n=2 Tax=Flexivirga caeni TaxID=2294115 RepID=A0A3M9MHU0_9MICO|nr:MFS transporter [Flexivirga caeni]
MTRLRSGIRQLIPPTPLSRRLALQSLLFATGEGTFMTGSAVFFTQVVGLSAAQVGLGLTVAGVVSFLVAYPAGRLVDVLGPKRMWAAGALLGALMFGVWPFMSGFASYLLMVVLFEIVGNAGGAGRGAYILDVMPEAERVGTQAYMYSSLNVGFTLGAIIGGVALAFDNLTVMRWLPLLALAIGLVNAFWIGRLPRASHDLRVAERERGARRENVPGKGPLRNVGWMALSFFSGTLNTNQVLLNVVIPLWLVEETDSPHWLLAWLFGTNTVLCIFLPAYTSRGVRTVDHAIRAVWISSGFFVLSCLITMETHSTTGLLTIFLVWLGHVAVTGAELANSAGNFTFGAMLMDPRRRGEYGGVAEVFGTLGGRWAPAAFTFLALSWSGPGWLVIAAIVVIAALGTGPAAHAAERFIQRELPSGAAGVVTVSDGPHAD